jgi:hypothetical protein
VAALARVSYEKQKLASRDEFDAGNGRECPDVDGPRQRFVLRCQGGGTYSAETLNTLCPCGKPSAAIVWQPGRSESVTREDSQDEHVRNWMA